MNLILFFFSSPKWLVSSFFLGDFLLILYLFFLPFFLFPWHLQCVYSRRSGSSPNRSREEIRFSDYRSSVIAIQKEEVKHGRSAYKKEGKGITILNINVCKELKRGKKDGGSKTEGKWRQGLEWEGDRQTLNSHLEVKSPLHRLGNYQGHLANVLMGGE